MIVFLTVLSVLISGMYLIFRFFGLNGVIQTMSYAYSMAVTVFACLYLKNRKFYLFIKKICFKFSKSCTFWSLASRFYLKDCPSIGDLFNKIERDFKIQFNESVEISKDKNSKMRIILKEGVIIGFDLSYDDYSVFVASDRPIMVPANYVEKTILQLGHFFEVLTKTLCQTRVVCNADVHFDKDVVQNPYFGLIVEKIFRRLACRLQCSIQVRCLLEQSYRN